MRDLAKVVAEETFLDKTAEKAEQVNQAVEDSVKSIRDHLSETLKAAKDQLNMEVPDNKDRMAKFVVGLSVAGVAAYMAYCLYTECSSDEDTEDEDTDEEEGDSALSKMMDTVANKLTKASDKIKENRKKKTSKPSSSSSTTDAAEDSAGFAGFYKEESEKNVEQLVDILDPNLIHRHLLLNKNKTMEIKRHDDDSWTIGLTSMMVTRTYSFKMDEAFEATTPDGRSATMIFTLAGGKIVCTETAEKRDDMSLEITKELDGDRLVEAYKIIEDPGFEAEIVWRKA